eukprot:15447569-Alexandrium_andersonii.AAC.1
MTLGDAPTRDTWDVFVGLLMHVSDLLICIHALILIRSLAVQLDFSVYANVPACVSVSVCRFFHRRLGP